MGRYGIISLADARAEAKRILAERTLGARRPKHVRFDVAPTEFCESHCDRKNRPGTAYETKRLNSTSLSFFDATVIRIAAASS
jgi:hypothetical protein